MPKVKTELCSNCHYKKKPFSYTLARKSLCRICSLEYERVCKICHTKFPAGFGRVCPNCHYEKTFKHKVKLHSQSYSHWMKQYFINFSYWLKKRRGALYTAMHLYKYQTYFSEIDALAQKIQALPTYEQLLNTISNATHKKNYLIHLYLDEIDFLKLDKHLTDKYANYYLIQKHLKSFEKNTLEYKILHDYYHFLLLRFKENKTTLRSIRLVLTPAVKFLQYCQNFKDTTPTANALAGYLFLYYGQRANITGFINFLSKKYKYNLDIKSIPRAVLKRPKVSHQILKGRLIKVMQDPHDKHFKEGYIFRAIIGYLHWVYVPQNVFISLKNVHKYKNGQYHLSLCGQSFYIPDKVVEYLTNR